MAAPTVFLSAATIDLKDWRDVLHGAFSRAGFRVLTQDQSLRSALGDVKRLLTETIDESDCIIHLAGMGYGSDATAPFPDAPGFQCSWTQFEYYHAHGRGKDVIAFVCAPDLSRSGFADEGDAADITRKQCLQQEHRARVASGMFDGTPLAGKVGRTLNERIESVAKLLTAVAAAVGALHRLGDHGKVASDALDVLRSLRQLPPRPEGFVGREAELVELRTQAAKGGALISGLKGMGGIGKTALALVLAHEWAARFPDAQLFLDARGTHPDPPTAGALLARVIQAFHPSAKLPEDEATLGGIYRDVLGGKKVLILLDNARDAAQAKPLFPPAGCALIVTSRFSFMLGTTRPHDVGKLPDAQAAALLREFHGGLGNADAAALVKLCAGLPLALRLAGAHLALDAADRAGTPDVAGYVNALGSGPLIALDPEATDAGEVTVSETLRLSEAQLPEAERGAWRALGVFTASFDARAAMDIAGADGTMLGHFVRRSMLEREGAERFKLHDLAADYARAQIPEPALTGLHLALARHCVKIAGEAEQAYLNGGDNLLRGLALFDRERAHLEIAFGWLQTRTDRESAEMLVELAGAIPWTSVMRFHPRIRIEWQKARLAAARILGKRKHECGALSDLGIAFRHLGDATAAVEFHTEQMAIAKEVDDQFWMCNALNNLGNCHLDLGNREQATACYREAYPIAMELPERHRRWLAYSLNHLGHVGEPSEAVGHHEQALAVVREIGDRRGEANTLGNLSIAHRKLRDLRKAIAYAEQQMALAREIGDQRAECNARGNLGRALNDSGKADEAISHFAQMVTLSREIGYQRGEANAHWHSALAHDSLANRPEAIARAAAALAIYEAIKSPNAAQVQAKLAEWRGA